MGANTDEVITRYGLRKDVGSHYGSLLPNYAVFGEAWEGHHAADGAGTPDLCPAADTLRFAYFTSLANSIQWLWVDTAGAREKVKRKAVLIFFLDTKAHKDFITEPLNQNGYTI